MKRFIRNYSLVALVTIGLPLALVGCNKSSDTDTTSSGATNTPPTAPDTNAAPAPAADTSAPATAPGTNNVPVPADSTKAPETNSPTDNSTNAPAPSEASKTNSSSM
jgi:hypothetical protein